MNHHRSGHYSCPTCRSNLTYNHENRQWWCEYCKRYPYQHNETGSKRSSKDSKTVCVSCDSQLRFVHQYNRWWCDFCGRYQTPKTVRKRRAFERPRKPNDKRDSHFGIDFGFSSNKHGHKSRSKHWHRHQAALNKAKKDKPKILYSSSSTDYYEVRGDEVFAAGTNRSASMGAAIYKVRGDCLYKTGQHPDGPGGPATHRISADRIYKTSSIHSSNSKRSGSKFYRGLRKNEDED